MEEIFEETEMGFDSKKTFPQMQKK